MSNETKKPVAHEDSPKVTSPVVPGEMQKAAKEAVKSISAQVFEQIPSEQRHEIGSNIGSGLVTISRAINMALLPLVVLVYCYEALKAWLIPRLEKLLAEVPPEQIRPPLRPGMVIAALEAARTADSDELKDMFARLIAASMHVGQQAQAHPAFVEILKQITSDEAKILNYGSVFPIITLRQVDPESDGHWDVIVSFGNFGELVGCEFPDNESAYIENLCRLGILVVEDSMLLGKDAELAYPKLANHAKIVAAAKQIDGDGKRPEIIRRVLHRTPFGEHFCHICGAGSAGHDITRATPDSTSASTASSTKTSTVDDHG